VTASNTTTPPTATETVHFKRCPCINPVVHGYLYFSDEKLPVTLPSIDAGRYLMEELGEFDPLEIEMVLGEMREAGIPDSLGEAMDAGVRAGVESQLFGALMEMGAAIL
jgi:hypothetical protein